MSIDKHGMRHKPAGLPQHEAGAYEGKAGQYDNDGDLEYAKPGDTRYRRQVRAELLALKDPLWDAGLLAATEPKRAPDGTIVEDHRGEHVLTPQEQIELVRRATWRHNGEQIVYGPICRALKKWFPNEAQLFDVAENVAYERMLALRISCAAQKWKALTPGLAADTLLKRPVRIERILAKPPYRMNPHVMRVGMRYQKRVEAWKEAHEMHSPDEATRDRLWDENMLDYVEDKIARGVTRGKGLTLSTGFSGDPSNLKGGDYQRLDADGRPYNGRVKFEEAVADCQAKLGSRHKAFEEIAELHAASVTPVAMGEAHTAVASDMEEVHAAWRLARERGLDVNVFAQATGVDADTLARWEREDAA